MEGTRLRYIGGGKRKMTKTSNMREEAGKNIFFLLFVVMVRRDVLGETKQTVVAARVDVYSIHLWLSSAEGFCLSFMITS
jgi:hypothetical protein